MICNGECGTFNPLLLECLCEIQDHIKKELQEAAYRSEMSDPERKNKKFEHYDNSQKKFFGAVIDMTFVINLRTAFDAGRSFFTENNRKICIRSKSDRRHLISVLYVIRRA